MQNRQEAYADELRKRVVIHCTDYRDSLVELLTECSPGHPMESGIIAAIAETERTIRNAQKGAV